MKLTDKYELIEPITIGRVMSFIAREVSKADRVVLHMFECPAAPSGEPVPNFILHHFRGLAPAPAGLVIATGTCQDSPYAYIVTALPEAIVLQAWVRAYKASTLSTADLKGSAQGNERTTADFSKDEPVPPPVSNKNLGLSRNDEVRDVSPHAAMLTLIEGSMGAELGRAQLQSAEEDEVPPRQRGSGDESHGEAPAPFTQQFMTGPHQSPSEFPVDPAPGKVKRDSAEPLTWSPSSSSGDLFEASPRELPSAHPPRPKPAEFRVSATGEFTKFFGGPFGKSDADAAPITPPPTVEGAGIEQRTRPAGEFTRVFGPAGEPAVSSEPASLLEPVEGTTDNKPGNFTRIFGTYEPSPKVPPARNEKAIEAPAAAKLPEASAVPPVRESMQAPKPSPPQPPPTVSDQVNRGLGERGHEATRVFAAPQRDEPPAPSRASTPSEYTRIMSSSWTAPPTEDEPQKSSTPPALSPGVFPMSPPAVSMPMPMQAPSLSPPVMQVPHVNIPPMQVPSVMPPTPSPQPLGATDVKSTSYLPLIIILNILFALAILLILYFALRH